MRAKLSWRLIVLGGALNAQVACGFIGHADRCPRPTTGFVASRDDDALTWLLPEDEAPALYVTVTRLPGPTVERRLDLLPVPQGWIFDDSNPSPKTNFFPPPEPCSGLVEWELVLGLPGREDSEPILLPSAVEYSEPEVVCPWDDEDNCLEVGIYL